MKRGRKKFNKKHKRIIQRGMGGKNKKNDLYVYLICSKCGKGTHIRTNDKSVYTDEVKAKWVCLFCK